MFEHEDEFEETPPEQPARDGSVERVQLGVRIEKKMAKVLKATAELQDMSLGELLENIVLHAFAGRCPFDEETLRTIADLKRVYGMERELTTAPRGAGQSSSPQRLNRAAKAHVGVGEVDAHAIIRLAQTTGATMGARHAGPEHLLLAILQAPSSRAYRVLIDLGFDPDPLRDDVKRQISPGPPASVRSIRLGSEGRRAYDLAHDEARRLGYDQPGSEHLLLGLLREGESAAARLLTQRGADLERVREQVRAWEARGWREL